jgi:N-acetylated-alpha-linked acidic dipeptidase
MSVISLILSFSFFTPFFPQTQQLPQNHQRAGSLKVHPDRTRLERFHRMITSRVRLAGTRGDYKSADQVKEVFLAAGLEVEEHEYQVYLSRPKKASLSLLTPKPLKLPLGEKGFDWDSSSFQSKEVLPHLAYTPSCDLKGVVIYANYGLPEDYKLLKRKGVDVQGRIVLVRYGKSFRGVKVQLAEEHGAKAILIYSDPADDGFAKGDPYPKGKFRPKDGVQRGSPLYIFEYPGDPLTPGEPSINGVQRMNPQAALSLPKIPGLPISWGAAKPILANLGGPVTPKHWRGGLELTYHMGPSAVQVHLNVENLLEQRTIRDVIGVLKGKSGKKGDFVLVGNHRDSWVAGGIDPASGTACLLETATLLGELKKQGYIPQLTIRLASWDGEEFGLIGSVEYGEQYQEFLSKHLRAYLNIDAAVSGPNASVSASPSLAQFAQNTLGRVIHPDTGKPISETKRLRAGPLGGGSDFQVFLDFLGIPCVGMGLGGGHGVYHSSYDSHWFMKNRIDPGFRYHAVVTRALLDMLHPLANQAPSVFQPAKTYGVARQQLETLKDSLDKERYKNLLNLGKRVEVLVEKAQKVLGPKDLADMDKLWLDPEGLFGRPWYRNLFVAPGRRTGYAAKILPGLQEAIESGDEGRINRAMDKIQNLLLRAEKTLQKRTKKEGDSHKR